MPSYWLIRLLLLAGLALIAILVMRPIRSQSHLAIRRLMILALLLFAIFAVLLPGTLNRVAHHLGVEKGLNLLVYALVIVVFAQLVGSYRKEAAQERRITALARAVALANADDPRAPRPRAPDRRAEEDCNGEQHRDRADRAGGDHGTIKN